VIRRESVKVVLPPEPPELTPSAARALLRILVKTYRQQVEATGPLERTVRELMPSLSLCDQSDL
jgi:hypothetical protein